MHLKSCYQINAKYFFVCSLIMDIFSFQNQNNIYLITESENHSVTSDSLPPHGLYVACQAPLSIEFSRPEYWSELPFRFPGDLPNPGIRPRSPTLQEDSLPAEPSGKPKIPGVGSLSLLHWIFLTQESNWGLLHCRWMLYQLSYQGSPILIGSLALQADFFTS